MNRGKRYAEALKGYDRDRLYSPRRGARLGQRASPRRVSTRPSSWPTRLGVDPRRADQIVRGSLSLPAGTGRSVRVAVFAAGEHAAEARAAGRRRRRRRRPRGADREGGLPRLRRRYRHAGPDGPGRASRARARAPWPHAEPEDRDCHRPTSRRQSASSRPAVSSTAPTASGTSTSRSARPPSTGRSCSTTTGRRSTSSCGPSRQPPRAATCGP